jgi:hypothetical protein
MTLIAKIGTTAGLAWLESARAKATRIFLESVKMSGTNYTLVGDSGGFCTRTKKCTMLCIIEKVPNG